MLLFQEDIHCKQHRLCMISRLLQPAVTTFDRPQSNSLLSAEQAAASHTAQHACCHGAYSTRHGNSLATQRPDALASAAAACRTAAWVLWTQQQEQAAHTTPCNQHSLALLLLLPSKHNASAHLPPHHTLHLQQRASMCMVCIIGSMQSLTVPRRFNTTLRRVKS